MLVVIETTSGTPSGGSQVQSRVVDSASVTPCTSVSNPTGTPAATPRKVSSSGSRKSRNECSVASWASKRSSASAPAFTTVIRPVRSVPTIATVVADRSRCSSRWWVARSSVMSFIVST